MLRTRTRMRTRSARRIPSDKKTNVAVVFPPSALCSRSTRDAYTQCASRVPGYCCTTSISGTNHQTRLRSLLLTLIGPRAHTITHKLDSTASGRGKGGGGREWYLDVHLRGALSAVVRGKIFSTFRASYFEVLNNETTDSSLVRGNAAFSFPHILFLRLTRK